MPNSESSNETALEIFGRELRSLRQERGFSLRSFAKKTGIQRSHLSEIENGKINITLDTLFCLADALDIQVSQLFRPLDTRRELYHAFRKV